MSGSTSSVSNKVYELGSALIVVGCMVSITGTAVSLITTVALSALSQLGVHTLGGMTTSLLIHKAFMIAGGCGIASTILLPMSFCIAFLELAPFGFECLRRTVWKNL